MKSEGRQPPVLAVWLMQHLGNEVLTGDLLERFSEGESQGWFWRQTATAILVGGTSEFRSHWAQICFSVVGALVLWLWAGRFIGAVLGSPAGARAWSWGLQLDGLMATAFDIAFRSFLAAVMVLPLLTAMLLLSGEFRWIKLVRTMLLAIPLMGVTAILWDLWADRFSSPLFFVPLMLATLLLSARAGCRMDSGAPIAEDGVFLAGKAVISGVALMYLLYLAAAGGMAEVLVFAVICGWIGRRLNHRRYGTMLCLMAISWLLLFGPEIFYWWKILADARVHPWFRTYLPDWFQTHSAYGVKFCLGLGGNLAGGWLGARGGLGGAPEILNDGARPVPRHR